MQLRSGIRGLGFCNSIVTNVLHAQIESQCVRQSFSTQILVPFLSTLGKPSFALKRNSKNGYVGHRGCDSTNRIYNTHL